MQDVAFALLPALVAVLLFATIVMVRRAVRGEVVVQAADGAKIALVAGHVMPLLAACVLYNAVVRMRGDVKLELAALCVVLIAFGLSVYRYLQVVDKPVGR